jgi:hypothetical protein
MELAFEERERKDLKKKQKNKIENGANKNSIPLLTAHRFSLTTRSIGLTAYLTSELLQARR